MEAFLLDDINDASPKSPFSDSTLSAERQARHLACKKFDDRSADVRLSKVVKVMVT